MRHARILMFSRRMRASRRYYIGLTRAAEEKKAASSRRKCACKPMPFRHAADYKKTTPSPARRISMSPSLMRAIASMSTTLAAYWLSIIYFKTTAAEPRPIYANTESRKRARRHTGAPDAATMSSSRFFAARKCRSATMRRQERAAAACIKMHELMRW